MNSKIISLLGLMISIVLLNACVGSGVKVKNTSARSQTSSNLPSTTTCTVGQSEQIDCTNEKYGAARAIRTQSCVDSSNGPQFITGSCFIESCVSGSTLINNYCVLSNCSGNSTQACTIVNGQGVQSRTCNNGIWSTYGACSVSSCNTGYIQSGNSCIAASCVGVTSQACSVTNGSGSQARTCNNGTWSAWGQCLAQSCNQGYHLENNICVSNTCVGSSTQACTIVNGQGVQSRTCNNGVWSTYGVCSVSSCNTGYIQSGNSCIVASCVGATSQACSVTNGIGSQARTCNSGTWSAWGQCLAQSCNSGYHLANNACLTNVCVGSDSQSCTITNGVGNQTRTCSLGQWSSWTQCTAQSCNQGYHLENNACLTNVCAGSNSQSCTITNGVGNQTRTCTNGVWSAYGSCLVTSCNLGYIQSGNTCILATCTGGASRTCSITNGTGTQTRTCTYGVWSAYGVCTVSNCNSGYIKVGNTCVIPTCEGATSQVCGVSNGMGNQSRTCISGVWSAWGQCIAQTCNQGYQLANGQCTLMVCIGDSTRTCSENNGQGVQTRECSFGVWSNWGACAISSCNLGYRLENNICVLNVCEGSNIRTCTVTNGSGTQSRTCTNGVWSAYGACQASTCNSGYVLQNGACVAITCPGSSTLSCYVENGLGVQTRYCSYGQWSDYGDCTVTNCNTGYVNNFNSCRPTLCGGISTRSCNVTNGLGIQSRTCNNGLWSAYGACRPVKCYSDTQLINGECAATGCSGSNIQTCSDSTGSGHQVRNCVNGVWSSYGACLKDQCIAGYEVKNQACVPVTCQMLSTQACSLENASGKQKHFCQNGTWTAWGPCILKECTGLNDYTLDASNNRCICSVYTTLSCTGLHGTGIKTRTCQNNLWTEYSSCKLYFCDTGYTLNAANNTCDPN